MPTLTAETFCENYAKAVCSATDGCGCPTNDGEPSCTEKNTSNCKTSLAGLIGAIALGDVTFDAENAAACIEQAAETLQSCPLPTARNRPAPCEGYLQDRAKLGESCSIFGTGLLCANGAGACNGMTMECDALPSKGVDCVSNRCSAGLVCDLGKCQVLQAENGPCGSDLACKIDLVCLQGKCLPPQAKGATCAIATECAAELGCIANQCDTAFAEGEGCTGPECGPEGYCRDEEGLKKCAAKAVAGEPCMQFDDCAQGTECDYTLAAPKCVVLPKLGEACPLFQCAGDTTCSGGICITPPKLGEPCANDAGKPCADGLGCGGGGTCVVGGAPGAECVGATQACDLGAACNFATRPPKCAAKGDAGAPCANIDALCKAGLFCNPVTSLCSPPLALGESCGSAAACGEGNYCDPEDGMCTKLPSQAGEVCKFECGGNLRCRGPSGLCTKGACAIR